MEEKRIRKMKERNSKSIGKRGREVGGKRVFPEVNGKGRTDRSNTRNCCRIFPTS